MNGFISHILNRHLSTDYAVEPRLPGRFEPPTIAARHPWTEHQTFSEPQQPIVPKPDSWQQTDDFDRQNQADRTEEPTIVPAKSFTERTQLPVNPSVESRVTYRSDAADKPAKTDHEFVAPKPLTSQMHTETVFKQVPVNPETVFNPRPPTNASLIYEPTQSVERVAKETGKSPSMVKPVETKSGAENGVDRQLNPVSAITSLVAPAARAPAALRFGPSGPPESPQQPVIKVSIGRIEVRAVQTPTPAKTGRTEVSKPNMSLEEYLNKRNNTR